MIQKLLLSEIIENINHNYQLKEINVSSMFGI